jgi:DNA polymerase-1
MTDLQKRLGDPAQTLFLLDTSSFIFRAFFAIRSLSTKAGEPTNAVYGVATMLARLAEEGKPEFLAAVYDSKDGISFRKEIYPEYKANRTECPPELVPQFDRIEQLVKAMEIFSYRQSGMEADDLIATLTKRWCALDSQHRVVIVSSDKDLMQLVNDRVQIWDTMANKIYGSAEVVEKFGVEPSQIRDYLGLVGDTSDNIPGVPSIGPKTAADLLKQYGNLDGVLKAAIDKKITGKRCDVICQNEKEARLSAELATVHDDIPVELSTDQVKYKFGVNAQLTTLLETLEFPSLLKRWNDIVAAKSGAAQAGKPQPAVRVESPVESPKEEPVPAKTPVVSVGEDPADLFKTVSNEKDFKKVLENLERTKRFAVDLETNSLNPREAKLCGVALSYD